MKAWQCCLFWLGFAFCSIVGITGDDALNGDSLFPKLEELKPPVYLPPHTPITTSPAGHYLAGGEPRY
ncbi:MAG: hypothetical protein D6820_12205, partial [Lentisphaerae bacterium]